MSNRHFIFSAIVLSTALGACGGGKFMPPPAEPSLLAAPESPAEVRSAIILGLADRKFRTEGERNGKILAHYSHGPSGLRVLVDYDGSHYTVRLIATRGYKTKNEGGEMLVEKRVTGALRNLHTAIERELARPAKERAEAERAQREYEMRMQAARTAQAQAEANTANANLQAQQMAQEPPPPPMGDDGTPPSDDEMNGAAPTWDAQYQEAPAVQVQVNTATAVSNVTCCINGARYTCPDQASFQACASMNPSGCTPAGACQ